MADLIILLLFVLFFLLSYGGIAALDSLKERK